MTSLDTALSAFELAAQADGISGKTIAWYVYLLNESPNAVIPWLVNQGMSRTETVSTGSLRQYIVWLRARPNIRTGQAQSSETIAAYIRSMHRFFGWCAAEYAIADPMTRIAFPKQGEQRPKAIDLNDIVAMFNSCGEGLMGVRDRAILAFLLDTGCRAAGLCGLEVGKMDMERQRAMVVEKGDKARMVVWTARTGEILKAWDEWRSPVKPFFYNVRTYEPLTPSGLRVVVRAIAKRAGVKGRVNPHSFRHAFAREYILNGGDLATLSRLMGHRQVSTTVGYYAVFTNDELASRHEQFSPMRGLEMGK